jgi:hypothetical protein
MNAAILALIAALLFGVGVAVQQHEAHATSPEHALHPSLLLRLASRPWWLVGLVADIAGWGVQAWALATGSLIVVQPVIALNLVFALAIAAGLAGQRITPGEWVAVVATLGGLIMFFFLAKPQLESEMSTSRNDWVLLFAVAAVVIGGAFAVGFGGAGAFRAAWFGAGAGAAEALMAVLSKVFANRVGDGATTVLATWTPYALVGAGVVTMLVVQTAYQAGHPTASLPTNAVVEPVLTAIVGLALFGERFDVARAQMPLVLLALGLMGGGVVFLARASAGLENVTSRGAVTT